MQELNKLVNTITQEMISSGQVEKMVRENIEKAISTSVNSLFREYSDFHKQLTDGLKTAIQFDYSKISIPEYNVIILDLIKAVTVKHMKQAAETTFLADLEKHLKPAPETVTVQEIIDIFKEEWKEDQYCGCGAEKIEVELEESSYGWHDLKIWKEKFNSTFSSRPNSPDIDLMINKDGVIGRIRGAKDNFGTSNYGAEAKLFQMYACKTIVSDISTCDANDLDTYLIEE